MKFVLSARCVYTLMLVIAGSLASPFLKAQNCTVNAGIDYSICASGSFSLNGGAAGLLNATPNYTWEKLSGVNCSISSPNTLTSAVTGFSPGTYTFRISAVCQDGITATDLVNITVLTDVTVANAGPDQAICKGLANITTTLNANATGPGETGKWSFVSGVSNVNVPSNTLSSTTNPTTNLLITTAGVKQLIWQISNAVCSKIDTIEVRVLNTPPPTITAGRDSVVYCSGNSYTFPNTILGATDPGILPQIGSWTVVTAPAGSPVPIFSAVNSRSSKVYNLVQGAYTFRWTISGPCSANKTADVNITMANVTSAPSAITTSNNTLFCSNEGIGQLVISGTGLGVNETAVWSPVGSPATSTVIVSPSRSSTAITGLDGISTTYRYEYRVTNATTGCFSISYTNVLFMPDLSTLSTPPDHELTCAATLPTVDTISLSYPWPFGTTPTGLTRIITMVTGPAGAATPVIGGAQASTNGTITTDRWPVSNLTAVGRYVFRIEYRTSCGSEFRNVTLYTSTSASASNAGSPQVLVCSVNNTSLIGNLPTVGIGSWTQVSGPNLITVGALTNNTTSVVNGLIPGNYVFRWNIASGNRCPSSKDDVLVTVASSTVVAANAGPDKLVCPGGGIKLSGNTPGLSQVGIWTVSPSAGISFSNRNDPNSIVYGMVPGSNYKFTWTINNSCASSTDDVMYTVSTGVSMITPNAGPDICLAAGTTTINLSGNGAGTDAPFWTALDAAVIAAPASSTTTATITGNGTYRFEYNINRAGCTPVKDTIVITVAPPASVSNAGADQNICLTTTPGSTVLNATAPVVGVGSWSQTNGGGGPVIASPNATSTSITNLLPGVYVFTYTIVNGVCASTTSGVTVALSSQPSVALAGPDQSVCSTTATTNVTLSGNTPSAGTGYWTFVKGPQGSAPTFTSGTTATTPAAVLTGFSYGVYTLRWNVSNGPACSISSDDVVITISQSANVTGYTSVCAATEVQLTGNTNSTGSWTFGASNTKPAGAADPVLSLVNRNSAIASALVSGAYTFTYTIPAVGNCLASTSIRTVYVSTGAPTTANAGADMEFCSNITSAMLTGNTPTVGQASWLRVSGPNSPTPGTANADRADTVLTNLVPGIYIYHYVIALTGVNSGCPNSTDSMQIVKEINANAGPDLHLCNVTEGTLTAASPVVYGGTWTQLSPASPLAVISVPNSPTSPVTSLVPGINYTFRYTINGPAICGANFDDVQLEDAFPFGGVNAGNDVTICANDPGFSIGTAGQTGISYSWSPVAYLTNTNTAQPTFTGVAIPGSYFYTLTASNGGCTVSDDVLVTVNGPLQPAITALKNSVCTGATTTVSISNAQAGVVYNWSNGLGTGTFKVVGPGTYTVTPVLGSCGGTSQSITIANDPLPVSAFTVSSGCSTSFLAGNAGTGTIYAWNFGANATPATATTSALAYSNVQYTVAGQKTATLTVTSSKGCIGTSSQVFSQSCILPIVLNRFEVNKVSTGMARLSWEISSAVNFKEFGVERSNDGISFTNIATVTYANNVNYYEARDAYPVANERIFYRLKMIDNDGTFKYSPIKYLLNNGVKIAVTVAPNPFTNSIRIMLPVTGQANVMVKLSDMRGRLLKEEKHNVSAGNQLIMLDGLANYSSGTYVLQVITNNETFVYKVNHL